MNWSDKAEQIAESVCSVKALKDVEIGDNIIYDEDGVLNLVLIRDTLMPIVKKAALQGMAFECDNWCKQRR